MNNRVPVRMDENTIGILDTAREKYGMSRSGFIRYAVRTQAASDGTARVDMTKYLVHFRSADGSLNREYMSVVNKSDLSRIYNDIVSIEEVA